MSPEFFSRADAAIRHRRCRTAAVALLLACSICTVQAQDLLIRNATVHSLTERGRLDGADVLVRDGRIAAVGPGLTAPDGVPTIEAGGRPLTPGLFAGLTAMGLEEVQLEAATVDHALAFGSEASGQTPEWRPEFDVVRAFNPESAVIGVNRMEGLTFTVLAPSASEGGSFVAGQGAAVTLDGRFDAELSGSRTLFVDLGADASELAGGSRAAQYMLLDQAIAEASVTDDDGEFALLTPAGRKTLAGYLKGGRVLFEVDRAADIHQVLKLAKQAGIRAVIAGGSEAWKLADALAQAKVSVLLDPLSALPASFDQLGARLDNAAVLSAAGVTIGFTPAENDSHNARKIRQLAGNAVANGLPWDTALAALTLNPARIFGLADRGTIAPGQVADLVLWSGDPLEVTTWADQVWIGGVAQPTRSRQTELLERYLPKRAQSAEAP